MPANEPTKPASTAWRRSSPNSTAPCATSRPTSSKAHAHAANALKAVHAQTAAYCATLDRLNAELRTLGDLGSHIGLRHGTITVDGVRYDHGPLLPALVTIDAAASGAPQHDQLVAAPLMQAAAHLRADGAIADLRALATEQQSQEAQ